MTNQDTRPWFRQVSREQWKAFFATFLGWLLDGFDFTIMTFILIDLQSSFTVDRGLAGALGTVTLLFRLVGGLGAGVMADRWGRKLPLMLSILWFSLFAFLSGFSTSYAMLFAFRALFGIGMGGEWAAGMPLALEHWPTRFRGIASGLLQGGWYWGFILSALTFHFVYPLFATFPDPLSDAPGATLGWRVMFWTGVIPALLVFWIRSGVGESPVWLERQRHLKEARQRRQEEARQRRQEEARQRHSEEDRPALQGDTRSPSREDALPPQRNGDSPQYSGSRSENLEERVSFVRLLRPDLLGVTVHTSLLMGAFMFSYYSLSFWYPTFLLEAGRDPLGYLIAFNAGAIIGTASWGRLSETALGRRGAVSLAALIGVASVPFFLAVEDTTLLGVGALLMGAMGGGIWGMAPSYLTERFPTSVRGVGPGLSYHVGAAIGSMTPFVVGQLQDGGMALVGAMRICIVTSGVLVAVMMWLGPETRGRQFIAQDDG